jgi:hypothetical protein
VIVDHKLIRQRYQEDSTRRHREDEEDTLVTCPGCRASRLIRVETDNAGSYKMFICPWCDGRGVTSAQMIILYQQYQKDDTLPVK